jgi:putative transposase
VIKNYRYRIYPKKKQAKALESILEECRWIYNHFLEERKELWENDGKSVSYFEQIKKLPELKEIRPSLHLVHSQVLQNIAIRIDLAFKAFFRRCQSGGKPGFPRFKGRFRYDSFTFPQAPSGCHIKDGKLKVSKVGATKIVQHRPLDGTPKTATLFRSPTGKWYVTFSCEVSPTVLPMIDNSVGIDVGLNTFAFLSDEERIDNPRFFKEEESELAKSQRKLSKELKGTPERAKRRKVVARIHERIRFKRDNFSHQQSRRIVGKYGRIFIEDLNVNRMLHERCFSKSISDAAWSTFFSMTRCKAEEAGRVFMAVNPAYTSQDCSACGHRQPMPLSSRVFKCPCCCLHLDRDLNAALNILKLGMGLHAVGNQTLKAIKTE